MRFSDRVAPRLWILMSLVLFGVACSSKKAKDESGTDIVPTAVDAGTDAIPMPGVETTSPSSPPSSEMNASNPEAGQSFQAANTRTNPIQYSVKRGDTLMKIAYEELGDLYLWRQILEDNPGKVSNPNAIPAGVMLTLRAPPSPFQNQENGERYLIQRGDTLGKISKTVYGTPAQWRALWENNRRLIHNPNKIFAGFNLYYLPMNTLGSTSPGSPEPLSSAQAPSESAPPLLESPSAASPAAGSPETPAPAGILPPPNPPSQ